MTMKFKIGFTIDAQTMFGMLAKFLPVENLHVEEVMERAAPKLATLPPRRIQHAKPVSKSRQTRPRKPDLKAGANGHIIRFLSDGAPHRALELEPVFVAAGYAKTGVASRLQKLKEQGVVFQPEPGLWQLTQTQPNTETDAA